MDKMKVITPMNFDETIAYNNSTEKWGVSSTVQTNITNIVKQDLGNLIPDDSLTYAKLKQLPIKQWSSGSYVIGHDASGNFYRISDFDQVFSDVGVSLYAAKKSGFVNEEYIVRATVTNSGRATASCNLLLSKPSNSNYSLKDWKINKATDVNVVRNSDLDYSINNLSTGQTVTVEFTVVPTQYGTYQFGATVNTNNGVDSSTLNNQASIILSANTLIDPNYVISAECPVIEVRDYETNKQLAMHQVDITDNSKTYYPIRNTTLINAYSGSLAGKKLTLTNSPTIVVVAVNGYSDNYNIPDGYSRIVKLDNNNNFAIVPSVTRGTIYKNGQISPINNTTLTSTDYTYVNGVLTFGNSFNNVKEVHIYMRPNNDNCLWQGLSIICNLQAIKTYTATVKNINTLLSLGLKKTTYLLNDSSVLKENNTLIPLFNFINANTNNVVNYSTTTTDTIGYVNNSGITPIEYLSFNMHLNGSYVQQSAAFRVEFNRYVDIPNVSGALQIRTIAQSSTSTIAEVSFDGLITPSHSIKIPSAFEINII